MARFRLVVLAALALAGAGCGSVPAPDAPGAPGRPSRDSVVPATLILDLGDRAGHDRSLLGPPAGAYEGHPEGGALVLRAAPGTEGPREIRLVPAGHLSRIALLGAGRLDAADLTEADLAAASSRPATVSVHVFRDFERLVLRLGGNRPPRADAALWRAVDRASLAEVLFPRTGRPADGSLPGDSGASVEAAIGDLPAGPLTILAREDDGPGLATARRIAAAWMATGIRTRVETLPFAVLRDRLLGGRFDAAVLRLTRAHTIRDGDRRPGLPPWVCGALTDPVAVPESRRREACRLYPLVSLDRVVGAGADLTGLGFDDAGRIVWTAVRVRGAS